MRTKDSLINEFNRIKSEMRGISPKLALHDKMQQQLSTLGSEIAHFNEAVIPTGAVVKKETVIQ